jgi:DNA invertase Pin-like site-specific DNA recombinase
MTRRRARAKPERTGIALLRVSTDAERQELGLKVQRAAIGQHARREGIRIVAWRVELVSGGAPLDERPRLLRTLAEVEAKRVNALLVHRLDRLARDPLVVELVNRELTSHRAELVVVTGGGAGSDATSELIRTILAAVGRFERRMIGARTKAALAVKRSRGEALGRPGLERYGYRRGDDGRLVEAPEEQATIARARELYAVEGTSIRAVAAQLAAEGRFNRAGRPHLYAEVRGMLQDAGTAATT